MMSFPTFDVSGVSLRRETSSGVSPLAIRKSLSRVFYGLRKKKSIEKQVSEGPSLIQGYPVIPSNRPDFSLLKKVQLYNQTVAKEEATGIKTANRFDLLKDMNGLDLELDEKGEVQVREDHPQSTIRKKMVDVGTQDCRPAELVQADFQSEDMEFFRIPSRKTVNKVIKNKKQYKVHSRLLNMLRIKSFMKYRDHHLISFLVTEARNWLVRNGHSCDNTNDYEIFSTAVMMAFLVSREELEFRQAIKDKVNYDNLVHLNKTVMGNLGKVLHVPRETSLLGAVLPDMKIAPRVLEV